MRDAANVNRLYFAHVLRLMLQGCAIKECGLLGDSSGILSGILNAYQDNPKPECLKTKYIIILELSNYFSQEATVL
jgi:hypothetical protein